MSKSSSPFSHEDHVLMRRLVRRRCPPPLREQLDDLTQMALMRVFRALRRAQRDRPEHVPALENPASRRAYFARAARTTVLDEQKRARHREEVRMSTSAEGRIEARQPTPEDACRGQELATALEQAITNLPPSRREPVRLYLASHSIREIATRIGKDRKQTSNLVHRGLRALRVRFRSPSFDPDF